MKKLIAIILSLVMLLSLAACGKENAGEQGGKNEETIQSNGNSDEPYEPIQPDGPMFWYNRQIWERVPEGSCGDTLLSGDVPTPIDLKEIDDYCQPYYCADGQFSSFTDLLASEEILLDERHPVYEVHPTDFGDYYDGVETIFLVWPEDKREEDKTISAAECYENGWWYLYFETAKALLPGVENTYDNPTAQGDALLALLGAPSYGLYNPYLDEDFETVLETNGDGSITGIVSYRLIYERDGYVLDIAVRDDAEDGELDIDGFRYYPEAYWEMSQTYSKDMTMLYRIPRGFRGAYTIPETVTEIKYMGAIECHNLTEVTIPSSVETVGSYAFECCDSLEVIRFTGDAPTFVYACFYSVAATVYYPAGNATWTEAVMTNPDLGSTELTWVAVPAIALNYPTLSFEDQIQYNVYFTLSDVSNVTEMGLITFDSKLTDGTIANAVDVIPGYTTSGNNYIVHSHGIPAKKLGDALYFKVYAKLTDGSYIYTNVAGYNAVAYAKSILGNAGSSMDAKRLMVAMLNYGAEAQVNFNYKTDNLMNAFLTDAQRNLVNAYDESMVDDVVAASSAKAGHFVMQSGSYTSIYPTISFEGAFSVNYYFKTGLTPDAGLTFVYWDADTYNSADKLNTANATGLFKMTQDGDAWTAAVEGIAAKDIDKTIYVAAVYKSGGTVYVSKVIPYSIGKYCETIAAQGNSFGAATAVYGYYAKTYFANL